MGSEKSAEIEKQYLNWGYRRTTGTRQKQKRSVPEFRDRITGNFASYYDILPERYFDDNATIDFSTRGFRRDVVGRFYDKFESAFRDKQKTPTKTNNI